MSYFFYFTYIAQLSAYQYCSTFYDRPHIVLVSFQASWAPIRIQNVCWSGPGALNIIKLISFTFRFDFVIIWVKSVEVSTRRAGARPRAAARHWSRKALKRRGAGAARSRALKSGLFLHYFHPHEHS